MMKKSISLFCVLAMLFSFYSFMMPTYAAEIITEEGKTEAPDKGTGAVKLNSSNTTAEFVDYEANVFSSGELQLIVKATGEVESYKLWKLAAGATDYTLAIESKYPILIYEDYTNTDKYAVSIVSAALSKESERYEITDLRFESATPQTTATWHSNILKGLTVVRNSNNPNTNIFNNQYGYDKLTDDIYDKPTIHAGRFSTKEATDVIDGTVQLGATYLINEVRIYDFTDSKTSSRAGDIITVYTHADGVWTEALKLGSKSEVMASKYSDASLALSYISLKLGYVAADAIRIVCSNDVTTEGITVYELTASGILVEEKGAEEQKINVFEGKLFSGNLLPFESTVYGYAKLTDGSFDHAKGRFALKDVAGQTLVMEADLLGVNELHELMIYDICDSGVPRIKSITIEVYLDGEWIKVVDSATVPNSSERASDANGKPCVFDLGGVKAEKIRMTMSNSTTEDRGISITEMICMGVAPSSDDTANVFDDSLKSVTVSGATASTSSPLTNAFDGLLSTKYEVSGSSSYILEIELTKVRRLFDLNVYDYRASTDLIGGVAATRSDKTYVELYINGEWIRVIDGVSMSVDKDYTTFNLYGLATSKIRIGFNNTRAFDNGSKPAASICEIICSTAIEISDRRPMLESYESLDALGFQKEEHLAQMEKFYTYLSDFNLHDATIAERAAEMTAYYEAEKDNVVRYVPKTSITLGSELTVNVYMPTKDLLSFTLDGTSYEDLSLLADRLLTLDDGEEYYKMSVRLPVTAAARDIELAAVVVADSEGGVATVTQTISIPKYAAKIIDNGTDVDKTLIRDVLSYVRAGYVYFDKEADVVDRINAMIGSYYDMTSLRVAEGSTNTPQGLKSATFNLTAKPAVRFYLNAGVKASDYSFKINGENKTFKTSSDEKGAYVEISVYAYEMCEAVECYYKGQSIGTYHIASYYNWALTTGDEELITVVERFWRYCQSARDYKNRASVQINYVDESGNQVAPTYYNSYKSGAQISVPSPDIVGYYTRDLYVIESVNEDSVYNVVYKPMPTNVDSDIVKQVISNLALWGDSITAGAMSSSVTSAQKYGIDLEALGSTSSGGAYVNVLQKLIANKVYSGISIAALGVGGESTSTIAARADTATYYLYLDGDVTISDSEVTIPLAHYSTGGRVGILRQGSSSVINPVTIVGKDASGNEISVTGSITLGLTDDAPAGTDKRTCDARYLKYTFTRNDGKTDALSFVSGARVITKASYQYDGRTCIIFMGENGGYKDVAELIKQQEEILAACGNPEFYLIISTTSGSNESRSEVREALSARWGDNYINMGDELNSSRKAYEFAGFSEEAILSVQENIANGTVTDLLLADICHPNAVGYAVIGNIIFERLFKLGAFEGLFDYYDKLNAVTTEQYTYNGYRVTVIRPQNPNGKWIWKTEFLTAFDKAERTLVNDGYTRVYYEVSNMYGSPKAVSLMESFYHHVIDKYDLDDKCLLFGFSRGGLYAFNFALAYPQYVDKIYLDAPVLDLKTWPTKANNPWEYSGMLNSYGLTEEEFATFKGSPIDKLEEFFALNIPLLVVAGDADGTVPFADNAGKLIEYANANGHTITYFVEEGKDHHPHSLTDVTPIVEFCKRGTYDEPVSNPLTKEDFAGKTITFLGDSITQGVGVSSSAYRYSSLVASALGMKEINMGISGTVMCTGGHRDSRLDDIQKISLDSDYVGILLGVNDFDQCRNNSTSKYYSLGEFGSKDTSTIYGALDKMCSDLVARFGGTDTKIFLMTPVVTSWNSSVTSTRDWDQSKVNACGYTLRELCDAIVEVATYYGIVTCDLNALCEMTSADFADGIHPNTSGTTKMAAVIEEFLLANYSFE